MKKVFATLTILAAIGALLLSGQPRANAEVELQAGDLIRGQTFSAVYYMGADEFRYVFPNLNTYKSWYGEDFSNVVWITDAQLAKIQIGGNVTYKPGTRMIKIDTDPKTYAPGQNGTLHHVTSEQVARDLYGTNWNKEIDDMPDGFFTNYTIAESIDNASEYNRASLQSNATSINVDRELQAPAEISLTDSGYQPGSVTIDINQTVRFTNDGTGNHTATSDDLSWGTGTIQPGDTFVRRFTEAGTFTFFDSYDSQLTGAIFVE